MAERARLQRNIGRDATNTKKALGDDRSAAQVAAKQAVNDVRPKGDDRSAAQVAAQKVADAARPKKRKLEIIEEQKQAALAALSPLPGKIATGCD